MLFLRKCRGINQHVTLSNLEKIKTNCKLICCPYSKNIENQSDRNPTNLQMTEFKSKLME